MLPKSITENRGACNGGSYHRIILRFRLYWTVLVRQNILTGKGNVVVSQEPFAYEMSCTGWIPGFYEWFPVIWISSRE
jgi:hypothetical protein